MLKSLQHRQSFIKGAMKSTKPYDPKDITLVNIAWPAVLGLSANWLMSSQNPLGFTQIKGLLKNGDYIVWLAYILIVMDLAATTNGTSVGGIEGNPHIRQWVEWCEINLGTNFAVANLSYEILFSVVFVLISSHYLKKGSWTALLVLVFFILYKGNDALTWKHMGWEIYSPLTFLGHLTDPQDIDQGGGAQHFEAAL